MHGTSCRCDHELAAVVEGSHWLRDSIDLEGVSVSNVHNMDNISTIFKSHSERFSSMETAVRSLDGEVHSTEFYAEILLTIPFRSPCKVHDIFLLSQSAETFPATATIYANIPDLDFASLEDFPAVQTIDIIPDLCGQTPHPLKVSKLQNVSILHLHLKGNSHQRYVDIAYLGIRGINSGYERRAVSAIYEAKPNVSDHDVKSDSFMPSWGV